MQFLKILFGFLVAFVVAVFTLGNWTTVPIRLPGDLVAETNLPLLLLIAFLAGLLPTLLYQQVRRWRLRQRLAAAERQLAELRALTPPPSPTFSSAPAMGVPLAGSPMPIHGGTIATPPVTVDDDSTTRPDQLL